MKHAVGSTIWRGTLLRTPGRPHSSALYPTPSSQQPACGCNRVGTTDLGLVCFLRNGLFPDGFIPVVIQITHAYLDGLVPDLHSEITEHSLSGSNRSCHAGSRFLLPCRVHSFSWLYGSSLGSSFKKMRIVLSIHKCINSLEILIVLIFITIGLGFKFSSTPFHQWTPNVYKEVWFFRQIPTSIWDVWVLEHSGP